MQNDAAEIAILAKHRAGEMLDEGVKNGLLAKQGRPKKPDSVSGFSRPATLKEVSVGEKESSRLRTLSGIPKKQLEGIIQEYKQERKELSSAKTFRLRQHNALPSYIINSYFVCGEDRHRCRRTTAPISQAGE